MKRFILSSLFLLVAFVLPLHAQWVEKNNGLTIRIQIYALAAMNSNLFAATEGGVYLSNNNGTSWSAVNTGLGNAHVQSLAVSGSNLFAGTDKGYTSPSTMAPTGVPWG